MLFMRHPIQRRNSELRLLFCLGALAVIVLFDQPLGAAPPANDTCAGAEVIPSDGPFPHLTVIRNISLATTNGDPPAPSCVDSVTSLTRSVWYSFRPAASGRYVISSCSTAPTATTVQDTVMAVYTAPGCAGPFLEAPGGCDDDTCGFQASVTIDLQAGIAYYIVVWRYGTDAPSPDNSSLQLVIDEATAPKNDLCDNATPLTVNIPVRGRTTLASNDYQIASSCLVGNGQRASIAAGRDVAYSFTAPRSANYSFRLSNYDRNAGDPVLYLIDSCPTGPKPITISTCRAAANRTFFGSSEEIYCVHLGAGEHVYLIVDDDLASSPGSTFLIQASVCLRESEPNDTMATAGAIICGIEGAMDKAADLDFYSLGIPAAGARLFAMIDGGAAPTSDFTLSVVTPTGTVEVDSGNNDEPFGSRSSNVAGTPLTDAASYIRIDRSLGAAEPYRLFAVVQPALSEATPESEPNDGLAFANSAPNNYFYGSLTASDVDSYQFDANAGDLLFISLDGNPLRNTTLINAKLELLDESGNLLLAVDDPGSTTPPPGEALVYRASESGTYFARVRLSPGATTAGDYLLSISRNCIPAGDSRPADPVIDSIATLAGGRVQISAHGTPGVAYRLLGSADLNSWWDVDRGAQTANGDGSLQFEDATPRGVQRFYRTIWP